MSEESNDDVESSAPREAYNWYYQDNDREIAGWKEYDTPDNPFAIFEDGNWFHTPGQGWYLEIKIGNPYGGSLFCYHVHFVNPETKGGKITNIRFKEPCQDGGTDRGRNICKAKQETSRETKNFGDLWREINFLDQRDGGIYPNHVALIDNLKAKYDLAM
jgi:hypothetical protein